MDRLVFQMNIDFPLLLPILDVLWIHLKYKACFPSVVVTFEKAQEDQCTFFSHLSNFLEMENWDNAMGWERRWN